MEVTNKSRISMNRHSTMKILEFIQKRINQLPFRLRMMRLWLTLMSKQVTSMIVMECIFSWAFRMIMARWKVKKSMMLIMTLLLKKDKILKTI